MNETDLEQIALAIEKDAGQDLPDIRQALSEAADATYSKEQIIVRAARKRLEMSQAMFANLIDTPVGTLRGWEQGRFEVPGAVITLMKVAIKNPDSLR